MSTDPAPATVPTEVQDLSGLTMTEVLQLAPHRLAPTTARIVARVDEPGRSISGYHPQRLDG